MQQSLQHKSNALDFLDLRRLTLTFTQIVQLRAANLTTTDDLDGEWIGKVRSTPMP